MTNQYTSQGGASIFVASDEPHFQLGSRVSVVYGDDSNKAAELIYVKNGVSNGTILANIAYVLPVATYALTASVTKATAALFINEQFEKIAICVPAAELAEGQYGWAFVKGQIPVTVADSVLASKRVAASATGGRLSDADQDYEVQNAYFVEAASAGDIGEVYACSDMVLLRNVA